MAVILPGAIISDLRGSIGGVSFHQGRAGIIASKRSSQTKAKTVQQSEIQEIFIAALMNYQALTNTQKNLWNDYAVAYPHTNKFGQQRILTGQNYFFALNYYRFYVGESLFQEPPARVLPPATGNYSVTLSSTQIIVTFDTAFNPTNGGIIIFATIPTTTITTSHRSQWRIIYGSAIPPFTTIDLTADYNTKFGIDYGTIAANGTFNIGIMILNFNLLSGVYSPGLIKIGSQIQTMDDSSFYYYA